MSFLVNFWHRIPEQIRFPVLKTIQRNKPLYRWLMFRHADLKDRSNGNRSHLPPAELRYRVGASPDAEVFIMIGKACAEAFAAGAEDVGGSDVAAADGADVLLAKKSDQQVSDGDRPEQIGSQDEQTDCQEHDQTEFSRKFAVEMRRGERR